MRPRAAEATLLDAAKGRRGIGGQTAVEAHHTRLDLFGDPQAAGEVTSKT